MDLQSVSAKRCLENTFRAESSQISVHYFLHESWELYTQKKNLHFLHSDSKDPSNFLEAAASKPGGVECWCCPVPRLRWCISIINTSYLHESMIRIWLLISMQSSEESEYGFYQLPESSALSLLAGETIVLCSKRRIIGQTRQDRHLKLEKQLKEKKKCIIPI